MAELFGGCGRAVDGTFWCFGPPASADPTMKGALDADWHGSPALFGPPDSFACIVRPGGSVACLGSDVNAQLGFATSTASTCLYDCSFLSATPMTCGYPCVNDLRVVPGVHGATQVSAQGAPCARLADGSVTCWGGDAQSGSVVAPHAIALPEAAVKIAGGAGGCALLGSGVLSCWALGPDAPIDTTSCPAAGCALPATVPGLDRLVDLSSDREHGCVVRADGAAFCWGLSVAGELGDGANVNRTTPVQVASDLKFATVSTDLALTCATTQDGHVACWGASVASPGVDGTTPCNDLACRLVPVLVPGVAHARQVSAATSFGGPLAYVRLDDGSVLSVSDGQKGWDVERVAP